MLTLVFDTETTGLPPKTPKPIEQCPWIIQLAGILFNGERPVAHFSTYVLPEHGDSRGTIPDESFWRDNHLTYPEIAPTAISLDQAMKIFNRLLVRADRVVAHNTQFDAKLMKFSYARIMDAPPASWTLPPKICTMLSAMPVVKAPAKWPKPDQPYKWPTLDESYRHLVNPQGFSGAHDAMSDVMACAELLFTMERKGIPLVSI